MIPAPMRRELRLKGGDSLSVTVEEGRLVLSRDDELNERIWAEFAHLRGTGVLEELRQERRRQALREAQRARPKKG